MRLAVCSVLFFVGAAVFSESFLVLGCIYQDESPIPVYRQNTGITFLPGGDWKYGVATGFLDVDAHLNRESSHLKSLLVGLYRDSLST
jgi:hypothetical protein